MQGSRNCPQVRASRRSFSFVRKRSLPPQLQRVFPLNPHSAEMTGSPHGDRAADRSIQTFAALTEQTGLASLL